MVKLISLIRILIDWRVVASYTQDNCDQWKSGKSENAFREKPRQLEFDEGQHKSLNAELKYLYTAITHAKCNLWIYDSHEEARLSMFDYWSKRGLVKVIRIDDITKEPYSRQLPLKKNGDPKVITSRRRGFGSQP